MVVIVNGSWIVEKNKRKVEMFDRQSKILRPKSSRCWLAKVYSQEKGGREAHAEVVFK